MIHAFVVLAGSRNRVFVPRFGGSSFLFTEAGPEPSLRPGPARIPPLPRIPPSPTCLLA